MLLTIGHYEVVQFIFHMYLYLQNARIWPPLYPMWVKVVHWSGTKICTPFMTKSGYFEYHIGLWSWTMLYCKPKYLALQWQYTTKIVMVRQWHSKKSWKMSELDNNQSNKDSDMAENQPENNANRGTRKQCQVCGERNCKRLWKHYEGDLSCASSFIVQLLPVTAIALFVQKIGTAAWLL